MSRRVRECPACDGDGEIAPSGETVTEAYAVRSRRVAGLTVAIGMAEGLITAYRLEGVQDDPRITAALEQIEAYRLSRAAIETTPVLVGELAWCIACRGTGLTDIECEGCGHDVDADSLRRDALDHVDVLVHKGCDIDHRYFEARP